MIIRWQHVCMYACVNKAYITNKIICRLSRAGDRVKHSSRNQ